MVTHRQRYREKVSQMVSWGHWFALFNILLAMVLGSRYLFVADWPTTLAGRVYSYLSVVGHFSFLSPDVYRHVPEADEILISYSGDGWHDAVVNRQRSFHPLPPAPQPDRLGTGH